jgi:hypothetical protein
VNQLLQNYSIQVDYPDVSGAEYLEVLQIRDRLAETEAGFASEERAILAEADRKLMMNTMKIHQELSQFIDLPRYRIEQEIPAQKWWWYLDVLNYLPSGLGQVIQSPITQRDLKSA